MHSVREILGFRVQAVDDEFGKLADVYFDDRHWGVRYLVLDTGNWLPGRHVLVSPSAAGEPDWRGRQIPVVLNRVQVENSPSLASDKPVSRQHEEDLANYFGWPRYWAAAGMPSYGFTGLPHNAPGLPLEKMAEASGEEQKPLATETGDPHLRSFREVKGYHIHATDGEIGHVEDFLADLRNWKIHNLVVDTKNWLPGKDVIIPCSVIQKVDWKTGLVEISMTKNEVENSPVHSHS